jgi:hypothetical protein
LGGLLAKGFTFAARMALSHELMLAWLLNIPTPAKSQPSGNAV